MSDFDAPLAAAAQEAVAFQPDGTTLVQNLAVPVPRSISPEAAEMLKRRNAMPAGADDLTAPVEIIREQMAPGRAMLEAELLQRYPATVENRRFAGVAVRIVTPAKRAPGSEHKLLINLHSGAFILGEGSITEAIPIAMLTGIPVLAIDYRLAPENPFPAAVEDTVAALTWLSHAAPALGIDAGRIAVAGDSAGAGLAAVALHETKGALAAPVRGQVLIYPALDLRGKLPSRTVLADHFPIPREMIEWFFNHYFGTAWPIDDPRAIPALYQDYSGLPAGLIITAGHDPLRDEGADYAERLAAAGVPVDYECCEGTIHGFMNMGRVLRGAHRRARQRLASWLGERLHSGRQ